MYTPGLASGLLLASALLACVNAPLRGVCTCKQFTSESLKVCTQAVSHLACSPRQVQSQVCGHPSAHIPVGHSGAMIRIATRLLIADLNYLSISLSTKIQ